MTEYERVVIVKAAQDYLERRGGGAIADSLGSFIGSLGITDEEIMPTEKGD